MLDHENAIPVVIIEKMSIDVGPVTQKIKRFEEAPHLVLFPVNRRTGKVVTVPAWVKGSFRAGGRDMQIIGANAVEQLEHAFHTPEMIEHFGELTFHSVDGRERVQTVLTHALRHGTNADDYFAKRERLIANVIDSRWMTIPPGKTIRAPYIDLREGGTSVKIVDARFAVDDGIGTRAHWCIGSVSFFGTQCEVVIENNVLAMRVAIESEAHAILEVKRLFDYHFPFIGSEVALKDLAFKMDQSASISLHVDNPLLRSEVGLMKRFQPGRAVNP